MDDEPELATPQPVSMDVEAPECAEPIDIDHQWKRNAPSANHTAALFLLTLQEKYRLSQKAVNFAVGSISTIVDSVCDSIKESVKNSLDLNSCFDFEDPFSSLQTEYQQTKFYREEFGLVVCIIINWLNNNSSFCHNYRNQLQWN